MNESACKKPPVSVIILTKNEEALIERCLSCVQWADEILILDCGSTDRTRELARAAGAVIYEQPWLGWARQHQRALELARNDWVVTIDADEIVTPELAQSILKVMESSPRAEDGYVIDRRDELFGKLLPNMKRTALQRRFIRLFNRTCSHYNIEDVIHETVLCPGHAIELDGLLLHWRNVAFLEQMRKDIDIARLEAEQMSRRGKHAGVVSLLFRPLMRFLWCYVYCGAFRLGSVGIVYSLMRAHVEFLRYGTVWERQHTVPTPDPPQTVWSPRLMPKGALSCSVSQQGE